MHLISLVLFSLALAGSQAVQFIVSNKCAFPLTITGTSANGGLSPASQVVQAGGTVTYNNIPSTWLAGRVNAHPDPSYANWYGLAEMTIQNGIINYDISYVDSLVMPGSIKGAASDCGLVGCSSPYRTVMDGCPRGADYNLLHPSGIGCLSACFYCADGAHASSSFCKRLDGQINTCATQPPSSTNCWRGANDKTGNVYCCSGYFDGQPGAGHTEGNKYCAALNRGTLSNPNTNNVNDWFKLTDSKGVGLYNEYSKYVHTQCPGMYSFAYDDYANPGSHFAACRTDTLYITWCPSDGGGQGTTGTMGSTSGTTGSTSGTTRPTPWKRPPFQLPGRWAAENFDNGGEGQAYHDVDYRNQGGLYRPSESVDIAAVEGAETGRYYVGWTKAGEWLLYTMDVTDCATCKYNFNARVAAMAQGGTFHVEIDGTTVVSSMTVPATGSWQTWATIRKTGISLPKGRHQIRVVMDRDGPGGYVGNFNWFSFVLPKA